VAIRICYCCCTTVYLCLSYSLSLHPSLSTLAAGQYSLTIQQLLSLSAPLSLYLSPSLYHLYLSPSLQLSLSSLYHTSLYPSLSTLATPQSPTTTRQRRAGSLRTSGLAVSSTPLLQPSPSTSHSISLYHTSLYPSLSTSSYSAVSTNNSAAATGGLSPNIGPGGLLNSSAPSAPPQDQGFFDPGSSRKARVLYDYDAADKTELSLVADEVGRASVG
jgi:hypothetical protein